MEAEIIQKAASGDEDAIEQLVKMYQEMIFRFAYLLTHDSALAEDVTQETFIRAIDHLHRFDTSRPIHPWLLQIAKNIAHNKRRSLSRYITNMQRFFRINIDNPTDIETQVSRRDQSNALYQAMQHLNDIDQEVIYLRYFLDCSIDETANIMDVKQGTVKSRLSRAKDRLREVILRDFPDLYEEHT